MWESADGRLWKRLRKLMNCWKGLASADLAGSERREMVLGKEFGDRTLSGGQWQRLALARCMFRKGNILVAG
ncbi:MAG: ATP-binding cassette domain-containing protein [Lachnospiraceae bacterium]